MTIHGDYDGDALFGKKREEKLHVGTLVGEERRAESTEQPAQSDRW